MLPIRFQNHLHYSTYANQHIHSLSLYGLVMSSTQGGGEKPISYCVSKNDEYSPDEMQQMNTHMLNPSALYEALTS